MPLTTTHTPNPKHIFANWTDYPGLDVEFNPRDLDELPVIIAGGVDVTDIVSQSTMDDAVAFAKAEAMHAKDLVLSAAY